MRYSMLLPAALLGLAGCAVPVQVPAGSQVTAASISPAPAGSLSPTVSTTYVTPIYVTPTYVTPAPSVTYVTPAQTTTTYVTPVPTTTQYVVPAVVGAENPAPAAQHN